MHGTIGVDTGEGARECLESVFASPCCTVCPPKYTRTDTYTLALSRVNDIVCYICILKPYCMQLSCTYLSVVLKKRQTVDQVVNEIFQHEDRNESCVIPRSLAIVYSHSCV